jgi:outer membrane receptor protein involved in Fe transport
MIHLNRLRSQWDIRDNLALDTMLYYTDELPDFGIHHQWRLDLNLGWQIEKGLRFNLAAQNLLAGARREFVATDDPFTPPAKIGPRFYGKLTWSF